MLSLGIKNAILVLLIILILHVLIKNALMETNVQTPTKKLEDFKPVSPLDPELNKVAPVKVPECPAPEKKEDDNAELLKYVYGDDADQADIATFFKGLDVTRDVEKEINSKLKCPVLKSDDNSLPLSTTCDPKLQNMATTLAQEVKADCNLEQNLQTMLIKEYKNENSMNGGDLYGNLSAYDMGALSYQEYECMLKN
jgi:hypothetical protein